jgi:mannose-6-phosphate isomerase-like protein (cupin superfamily)
MEYQAINIADKFTRFTDQWHPYAIARLNDYVFKIARIEGEFVWHKHDETDEVFIIQSGPVRIEFRDGSVTLRPGEMFVVPRGVEHKPIAEEEAQIIMVEPEGTRNTGDVENERTVDEVEWI